MYICNRTQTSRAIGPPATPPYNRGCRKPFCAARGCGGATLAQHQGMAAAGGLHDVHDQEMLQAARLCVELLSGARPSPGPSPAFGRTRWESALACVASVRRC